MAYTPAGGGGYDPSGWLFEPSPEEAIPAEWDAILGARDKVPSLGKFALTAWTHMGGDDIPTAWSDMLAGDWQDVSRTAGAYRNLSKFCETYADKLDSGVGLARSGWKGEAADAMGVYFAGLSAQMRGLSADLDHIADNCNEMAFGVYECGKSVEDGIEAVFDLVLCAAASLAAAAATSWTGAGGLIGSGAAAASIAAAVLKVKQVVDAIDAAFQIANASLGVVVVYSANLDSALHVSLPGDYDNKAV
ncbi:hypothetical protein JQN72_06860 [Phycicoccus sp. CSK15P-2]|uniref:WXG100 family type VII secretion target n=1 Tax=Phycicoccus sp. CSK15P-2 TaxID=2807627 RepID=UPI00194E202C|nr:hypothetical protein [Phycicoccus sp. CSK15P-2]MBM6403960.1 hypothetical protein [Phycicoccus sp. CSK15P-2]